VKSDLKDLAPGRTGAAFPHDQDQTPPARHTRRRRARRSASSDRVTHTVPRGAREGRGGSDRLEQRRRASKSKTRLKAKKTTSVPRT
jgi:hypothetical protein